MVEPAAGDDRVASFALSRVPDLPQWIDTRGMLLSGRARVLVPEAPDGPSGVIVVVPDSALASIVGRPPAQTIARTIAALRGDVNVLAQMEDADHVGRALGGWHRRTAIIHVLPGVMAWERERDPEVRVFTRQSAPRFNHVPESLRCELLDALNGRTVSRFVPGAVPRAAGVAGTMTVPMAAVWADGRPVSFCYPVWQTESRWDVSIETLASYRRRGLAARAARTMIRYMRGVGRAPVWSALETNTPSRRLAASLGFLEAAGLAVFTEA
jgi:GNAT superfamily N-acetyltransferase